MVKKKPVRRKLNKRQTAKRAPSRPKQAFRKPAEEGSSFALPLPWTWDLGITQSALTAWNDCPEQFYQNYICGYTGKQLKTGLEFGSIWHLCQEHQFTLNASPATVARKCCRAYEKFRKADLFSSQHEQFQELLGIAEVMFPLYCEYFDAQDSKIDWLEREQKFRVPYEFLDYKDELRTVDLIGMRDGVYRAGDALAVFETKTKSVIDQNAIRDQLHNDLQTLFYAASIESETKQPVEEILYNVVYRPRLKQKQSETLNDFLLRIRDDVTARPEHYFMRWTVTLDSGDIQEFRNRTLDPLLALFAQWWDAVKKNREDRWSARPYHFLNSSALVGKYGKCDLWDLIVRKKYNGYFKRRVCFPELNESIPVN